MTNRHYKRTSSRERVELKDVLKRRQHPQPLTKSELQELSDHLARKKLLIYDKELDSFKEER